MCQLGAASLTSHYTVFRTNRSKRLNQNINIASFKQLQLHTLYLKSGYTLTGMANVLPSLVLAIAHLNGKVFGLEVASLAVEG